MNENDLIRLKQQIDEAKEKNLQLKGQMDALMQQLKEDWKCDSIEQANKKLKQMEKQVNDLTDEIETGIQELEEKYFKDE